jgi:REP element-mobilizing transposase RayT
MVRGINKSPIFRDDQDKTLFLERLGQNLIKGKCAVYSWVLMPNHVHLLFKSGQQGISAVMRKLLTWYAQYFNRRHGRTGHLFENRYKSILCDEDEYLLALVRYIHLNPIRGEIVTTLKELDHYPWSGHSALMGNARHDWMDTGYILSQFGSREKAARKAYRRFVGQGMDMGRIPELTGGGLIRSKGGWSKVLSVRRSGQREESDERILGSGDFVNAILKEAEEKTRRQLKLRRTDKTINEIIEEECKKERISVNEIKGGSRRSKASLVRARIAKRGVDELGLSMAEIARHVGVNTSSVAKAVARLEEGGLKPNE